MTGSDRLDRDLTAWFAETATPRVPDYVDDIFRQTAPVRQRPRWTFIERWLPMSVVTFGGRTRRSVPWRTVSAIVALLLLLVLVAVALSIGGPRRVPPPFGIAANGSIAYVQTLASYENQTGYHEPFGDIAAVDPSTGSTTTLVGGPELDGEPAYSLDGTRLSFVRQVDGGVALYAMDVRGGTPRRLTKDAVSTIREAAWSPDGRSIAFTVASGDRSDLWIAKSDGSAARRIDLPVSAVAPQWRPPDGRELLFVGSAMPGLDQLGAYHGILGYETATGLALYRVPSEGGRPTQIGRPGGTRFDYAFTTWTPDGRRIVTQVQDGIGDLHVLVLDADGNEVRRISTDSVGTSAAAPAVSPDGQRIAYAAVAPDTSWRLHVRPIDGDDPDVTTPHEFAGAAAAFRWSPNGKLLIVNHHFYPGTWYVDPDGGPVRQAPWTDPGYTAFQRQAE